MRKGNFIVFEGIDGSGKTTQFNLFCKELKNKGFDIFETSEPTRGNIGELIREKLHEDVENSISKAMIFNLLFYADRVEHNLSIQKNLESGKLVVSDRYYHSTLAYQAAQGLDLKLLVKFHKLLQDSGFVVKPDKVVFIDVPAEEAIKRIEAREKKRVEIFERLEFLKKVRENYLKLQEILDENIFVVDGTGSVEEVRERVLSAVRV